MNRVGEGFKWWLIDIGLDINNGGNILVNKYGK
jgi:hypothetical protein